MLICRDEDSKVKYTELKYLRSQNAQTRKAKPNTKN